MINHRVFSRSCRQKRAVLSGHHSLRSSGPPRRPPAHFDSPLLQVTLANISVAPAVLQSTVRAYISD